MSTGVIGGVVGGMGGGGGGLGGGFHGIRHYGEPPRLSRPFGYYLRRMLALLRPYWARWLAVFVIILLNVGLGTLPPLIWAQVIDRAIPRADSRLLVLLVLAAIGTAGAGALVGVAQNYLTAWMAQRIIFDLRGQLFRKLQRMSLGFFTESRTGEIMSRVTSDVAGIEGVVSGTLVAVVTNVITIAWTLTVIFAWHWQLALIAVAILPLFVIPTRSVGRFRWRVTSLAQQRLAELNALMQEALSVSGHLVIQAFARESEVEQRFDRLNEDIMRLNVRSRLAGRWFFAVLGLFGTIGPALIYLAGGHLVMRGELTVGALVAFVAYLGRLYGPSSSLANVHVDLMTSMALFERIYQYLDLEPEVKDGPVVLGPIRGEIRAENVTFGYDPDRPVLREISFVVEPGQLVALVGPSGSGKTTLTYLVMRFFDPQQGRILIDGVDLRQVQLSSLRRQIGVVTQETFLFHASVRENLLYGKPSASSAELEAALRAANVADVVERLPQKLDTIVGERGFKLSGGEKQRLAIARAILADPRILILDEATSSLDSEAEALVQQALERLLAGRTSLVIAHRLSTILKADQILVLENGTIVERGTHQELLARGGLYRRLYEEQFRAELERRREASAG